MKTKNILLLASLILNVSFYSLTNAKVITCSNNVLTAGQYTSIQAAHDAANAGDTVYVTPSPTAYGDLTISKKIALIGAGYFVTGTQYNNISQLSNIYLNSTYGSTITSGLRLQGLKFGQLYITGGSNRIDGVIIERCNSTSTLYILGNNWILKNNTLNTIYLNILNDQNSSNLIIANNFLLDLISNYYTFSNTSLLIINNIFTNYGRLGTLSYATVANNIFYFNNTSYNDPNGSCSNCTFNYNYSFSSVAPYTNMPNTSNSGGSNFNNINPNFVGTLIGANTYNGSGNTYNANLYGNNWHLKNTITGSDGTEIGIYGGSYPLINTGGVPAIPQMQLLNIYNAVVPQGGTLNVNFKARKQN